ncbi:MAG: CvpA family protein [Chloroflexi bacterium]|nr:CvpA family protein [Chloroflexota bacterium]
MNWLDFLFIAVLIVGAFMGMRTGLLGAAVIAIGVFIGWFLAGRLSDDVGALFGDSLSADAIVTAISYAIIMILTLVAVNFAWKLLRPVISTVTLGMAGMIDKIGGLALGFLVGFAVVGAIIIVMARFTYNFELPEDGFVGTVTSRIPAESTREAVEGSLTSSSIVPVFINATDAIPGNALGFVPADFRVALDILEQNIEAKAEAASN